ncbi:MAG: hypothetical protein ACOCUS_06555 [Polyangiales bacterium]
MTTYLIVLGVGSLVGGALGFKLGRGYERIRPARKGTKKKTR